MARIISNQATATYSIEGSEQRRNTTSNVANTTLLDPYSLEVSKQSLQQNFVPGENITYTIRVTNTGYRSLNNFTITDTVTEGAEYVSYMASTARLSIGGDFITLNPTNLNPLTFSVPGELASGETFTLTYIVTISSTAPITTLQIVNTANVVAKAATDPESPTTYSDEDSATVYRNNAANLTINKAVSKATIFNSDNFEYIITISNNGLSDATNVVVTDQLPEGFVVSNIRLENGDIVHDYDASEYTVSESNLLTIPSVNGTAINVKANTIDESNQTIITISGNYNA